jgi:preflagellin peptidase FlaK
MNAQKAIGKFVWPMEKIEDGKKIKKIFPVKNQRLEDFGDTTIWVTPKVPFMIFLLIGFLISFIVGDILYIIISTII